MPALPLSLSPLPCGCRVGATMEQGLGLGRQRCCCPLPPTPRGPTSQGALELGRAGASKFQLKGQRGATSFCTSCASTCMLTRRSPEYFGPVPTPPRTDAEQGEGGEPDLDPTIWTPYQPHLYPAYLRDEFLAGAWGAGSRAAVSALRQCGPLGGGGWHADACTPCIR